MKNINFTQINLIYKYLTFFKLKYGDRYLQKGDKITEINLPSIDGKNFSFNKIKGKKTLLTFYRFATCPFCNLRIHEIINRYEELAKNFHSNF